MKRRFQILGTGILSLLFLTGCVSQKASDRKVKEAYLRGKLEAMQNQASTNSVWVIGNVAHPVLPWTEDMTLATAIVKAEYRGLRDPREVVLLREGSNAFHINAAELLKGFDIPLHMGDRLEIRP